MTAVSAGWRLLELQSILAPLVKGRPFQQGWSPQCEKEPAGSGEWGVLKTTSIQPGSYCGSHNKRLPDNLMPRPELEVHSGDLLITCAGPRSRCGVPALVRASSRRRILSGKMYRFRPDPEVCEAAYLELFLLAPEAQRSIDAMKTGISESGLNLTHARFGSLKVPLPSLDEQRRIIDILEDHLSRLDAALHYVQASVRRMQAMISASLLLLWNSACAVGTLYPVDMIGRVITGSTPPARLQGAFGTGMPFVTPVDVGAGQRVATTQRTLSPIGAAASRLVGSSAALVVCIGATLGKVGWVDYPTATNQQLNAVETSPSDVRPDYLAAAFASPVFQRQMWARASTTTIPLLNKKNFSALLVPVPEPHIQASLIEDHSGVLADLERLKSVTDAQSRRSERLRRALLSAAFSGRLTGRSGDTDVVEELAAADTTP